MIDMPGVRVDVRVDVRVAQGPGTQVEGADKNPYVTGLGSGGAPPARGQRGSIPSAHAQGEA